MQHQVLQTLHQTVTSFCKQVKHTTVHAIAKVGGIGKKVLDISLVTVVQIIKKVTLLKEGVTEQISNINPNSTLTSILDCIYT